MRKKETKYSNVTMTSAWETRDVRGVSFLIFPSCNYNDTTMYLRNGIKIVSVRGNETTLFTKEGFFEENLSIKKFRKLQYTLINSLSLIK